ncbi:MAG: M64 family metallopeptidase [Bacteroidia bacterium]
MKKFLLIILCFQLNALLSQTFEAPFFSFPFIQPAADLVNEDPSAKQLDPNKIHLVVLGDGYNVIDEVHPENGLLPAGGPLSITQLNRFFNSNITEVEENEYGFYEIYNGSVDDIDYIDQGDSEDFLDYLFGDELRSANELQTGHWLGYTPYKQYSSYFNTYRVLYNSNNGNGIGHPYAVDLNNFNTSGGDQPEVPNCESSNTTNPSCITPLTTAFPNFENQVATFWSSNLDFCNSHRAISVDYDKIDNFIDVYFPNVPVFVIVLVNTNHYGGAANINKRTAAISSAYSRGIGGSYPHFDERGGVHELTHIFGKLQDEYYFAFNTNLDCFSDPLGVNEAEFNTAPNRTNSTYAWADDNHTWHHWYQNFTEPEEPLIGNFPHTVPACQCFQPYGATTAPYFKPTNNKVCLMEEVVDVRPFCAVCREAIIERVHDLTSPINSQTPADLEATYEASSSLVFDLNLTTPNPNTMRVKWELVNSVGDVMELETDYNNATDANGNAGAGGGAPGGFYRWHLECSRFEEEGFNAAGDYTVRARIFDMTATTENAANRWVRHPQHEIDEEDETNGNHEEIVEWTVNYSGIPGTDLYAEDISDDGGIELSSGSINLWSSPDIWLCNDENADCAQPGDAPSYDGPSAEAQVNLIVKNRGCKMFDTTEDDGTVTFWWAKAKTNLEWPNDWDGDEIVPSGPLEGDQIGSPVNLTEDIDITNTAGVVVSAMWDIPNPEDYAEFELYNAEVAHFCFLALVTSDYDEAVMINDSDPYPLYRSVLQSNNIVWRNIAIIDDFTDGATGQTTSTDVIRGGAVIVSNNESVPRDYKIKFEVPSTETGKPITEEAEVRIMLSDSLWSKWIDGGQQAYKVAVYDSSLHQLLLEDTLCTLSGIQLDSNSHFGMYVSVNFLTQERTSKELFNLSVKQILDDTTQRVLGGEMYAFMPDPSRPYFTANAGPDQEVVVGTVYESKASTLSETAIYNWYNLNGNRLSTGSVFSDTASSAGSETFNLELIATTDGYKDYDQVTITKKLGRITSVVPNPISTGTLAIAYKVSSTATSPKIRIVNISTSAFTEHTISTGTGTLNIDISAYTSGAHSILLICNSTTVDDELLVVQ